MDLSEFQNILLYAKGGYKVVYRAESKLHGIVAFKIIDFTNDKV